VINYSPDQAAAQPSLPHDALEVIEMNHLVAFTDRTHALIAAAGARASYRFFEFFTAQIRNTNTRRAYARAAVEFFDWLAARGVTQITAIESVHVCLYRAAAEGALRAGRKIAPRRLASSIRLDGDRPDHAGQSR
jgi:hypothetical protein